MVHFVVENAKLNESTYATDFLAADPVVLVDAAPCPACGGPLEDRRWLPPHRAEITAWGPQFGDIAFGPGDDLLVSERFVDAWRKSGLVGLSGFDPVEIVKVDVRGKGREAVTPAYWRVDIPFSKAMIDEESSGICWHPGGTICPECRFRANNVIMRLDRVVLAAHPQPAEDIFFARGLWGVRIASERFAAFCAQHDLLNVKLIPAENFSFRYDYLYEKP
jgi:hypothetical protein